MTRELEEISRIVPVLFPVHPRTRQRLAEAGISGNGDSALRMIEPLSYQDFLGLQMRAKAVITDSGGIQEETTNLGVPCLTVRENTERPVTIEIGSNVLVGRDIARIRVELQHVLNGGRKPAAIPPLWDGHAAERIAGILVHWPKL